jgi:hypothetical protein
LWLENQIYGLRNRYVVGESDVWLQKQMYSLRVRFMASETDMSQHFPICRYEKTGSLWQWWWTVPSSGYSSSSPPSAPSASSWTRPTSLSLSTRTRSSISIGASERARARQKRHVAVISVVVCAAERRNIFLVGNCAQKKTRKHNHSACS